MAPEDGHAAEDGYTGPARLETRGSSLAVQVRLRGHFQPIDGRYHWYGRIGQHQELLELLGSGRASGVLITPEGSARCELSDPDLWGRYRVTGISAPPYAIPGAPPHPGGTAEPHGTAGLGAPSEPRGAVRRGGTGEPVGAFEAGAVAGRPLPRHVRVAVIGAGFSGIGAGIRLRQHGIDDFIIAERAASVGGTWRDNTYPGCACDVPSRLYSFSFAPNPRWSRSFSRQPEIWRYLEEVTGRFGLRDHISFTTEVERARWDAGSCRWELTTSRGALTADVLVAAAGPLSEPSVPAIPGLASFPGEVFHSARWDHGTGLTGKRVAVVGTGASAIQIVPEIQPKVDRLVVFQRTPAWVLPRRDRAITEPEKWLYEHVPATAKLARLGIYLAHEALVGAFVRRPGLLRMGQRAALSNIARSISDPGMRAALTPGYTLGCKRILFSSTFYPALAAGNTELVAAGLAKVDGATLTAQDGTAHEVDAIIFATGFRVIDMPIAGRIHGAAGASLAQAWDGDLRALRGTTVPGFPNLCLLLGPNSGLGHNSLVHVIESQLSYLISYLTTLARTGAAALDARPQAQERWCAGIERRMARSVWTTGGCVSWYLDGAGRNPTLWPGSTLAFRRATRAVDQREYRLIHR
jgi:cation diffusion facilitator CzcD-associated flavoprotein CzcO